MRRFDVRPVFLGIVLVLGAADLSADPVLTGIWSGTYNESVECGSSRIVNSGAINLTVAETPDASVMGVLVIEIVERSPSCGVRERTDEPFAVSGSISTGALNLRISGRGANDVLVGNVSGDTMTLRFGTDGQATLKQTSQSAPDTRFTGTYSGSYSAILTICGGPQTQPYSGSLTVTIFHAGRYASGFFNARNSISDVCQRDKPPAVITTTGRHEFVAEVEGNSLRGFLWDGEIDDDDPLSQDEDDEPFHATVVDSTLSGGGASFSFNSTRTTNIPSPVFLSLSAEPQTVAAGQPATLQWNLFNAVSVGLDQGIGPRPVVGSVTVRPVVSTTYRVTATGRDGTLTTETISVSVAGGRGRRRSVRH